MKIYTAFLLSLLMAFFLFSFNPSKDEIRITGNLLLSKVNSLDESKCENLAIAKNYLLAYQQLYQSHKDVLKNNSVSLSLYEQKHSLKKCEGSILNVPDGFTLTRRVTVGGQGGGSTKGKEIPPYVLATFYMNIDAKESFLSNLPNEVRNEYFKLSDELKNEYPEIQKSISIEANQVKALDNKNYLSWYFQNNKTLLEGFDSKKIEEFKLDLKEKTLEFKQN